MAALINTQPDISRFSWERAACQEDTDESVVRGSGGMDFAGGVIFFHISGSRSEGWKGCVWLRIYWKAGYSGDGVFGGGG